MRMCMCVRAGTSTLCVMTHLPSPLSPTRSIEWLWWRNCNVITVPTLRFSSLSHSLTSPPLVTVHFTSPLGLWVCVCLSMGLPCLHCVDGGDPTGRTQPRERERERKTLIRRKDDKTRESRTWQEVMWVHTNCALRSLRSHPHNAKAILPRGFLATVKDDCNVFLWTERVQK